jgi:hypothetical protein
MIHFLDVKPPPAIQFHRLLDSLMDAHSDLVGNQRNAEKGISDAFAGLSGPNTDLDHIVRLVSIKRSCDNLTLTVDMDSHNLGHLCRQ